MFGPDNITAIKLQLRKRSPFFASLLMFAQHEITNEVPTAATDGKSIFYNADFMGRLSKEEQIGVCLHEVLHMALGYFKRVGSRDKIVSNQAHDYVINLIITDEGFSLPQGCLLDEKYRDMSFEEVYTYLMQNPDQQPQFGESLQDCLEGSATPADSEYWKQALQSAATASRMAGNLSANLDRLLGKLTEPTIPWQQELADFVVQTQADFGDYDRYHIWQGIYEDELESDTLRLTVAVDTSGSISESDLVGFISELQSIVSLYPSIQAELFWWDSSISGPYELTVDTITKPTGGGGTSLLPLWRYFEENEIPDALVVMTDGYLDLNLPELCPTLWCATVGGLKEDKFPFGKVVRLTK